MKTNCPVCKVHKVSTQAVRNHIWQSAQGEIFSVFLKKGKVGREKTTPHAHYARKNFKMTTIKRAYTLLLK